MNNLSQSLRQTPKTAFPPLYEKGHSAHQKCSHFLHCWRNSPPKLSCSQQHRQYKSFVVMLGWGSVCSSTLEVGFLGGLGGVASFSSTLEVVCFVCWGLVEWGMFCLCNASGGKGREMLVFVSGIFVNEKDRWCLETDLWIRENRRRSKDACDFVGEVACWLGIE